MGRTRRVDWEAVRRIMGKCVRGAGYMLSRDESRLLDDARKSDVDRYRRLHAEVKGDAVEEMTLGMTR